MADVPAPVETNRGPRVQTNSGGIGYFIPPELREKGRQALNLASALDPVQGIMRGMRASGRAADTELSPEERKAALIEAGIETAAPLAMMGLGALAKQPVKATVLDILTPTGAPQAIVDDVADPSRRAFMKGAVATGGIAAIAPDVITEALEKVPAAVKRVRGRGQFGLVLDQIAKNKEKASELYDKTRDLSKKINPYLESIRKTNLPIKTTPEEIQESVEAMGKTRELQKEAGRLESVNDGNLNNLLQSIQNSPKILDDAQDADLDEFIAQLDSQPFGYGERLEDPEFSFLYDEIKKRGLHQQKTKDGLDEYPYARMFVEDYEEGILEINPTTTPSSFDMKMTDRDTIPVEDLVERDQEDRAREMIREALVKEFELGQEKGLSSEQIDTNIAIKRRTLEKEYGIDFSKAEGGEMRKGGEKTFEFNSYDIDGQERPAIDFKDGTTMFEHEILEMFDQFKTAPEPIPGNETKRQILRFLFQNNPTKEEFIKHFSTHRLAQGGEMRKGVGSLSETARRMNEGGEVSGPPPDRGPTPQGIGSLSETARRMNEGGPSSIDDEVNAIVPAVIMAESRNDPKAVSEDGAIGLMQVLPSTAMKPGYGLPTIFELAREQGFVVDEETPEMAEQLLFMPDLNVEFGSRYLKAMRNEYDTMEDALRAYNAGPGNFNDYLAKGRDLSALDDEAVQYPLRVAAAGQGINPNEPAQYEAFTDSPEAFSTFMNMASEERPPAPRPRARPSVMYDGPRPMQRPMMPQDAPQQQMVQQAVASAPQPQSLQQKYSPQGIEQMLTGTNSELLLPRQFQQGSPYSSMQ